MAFGGRKNKNAGNGGSSGRGGSSNKSGGYGGSKGGSSRGGSRGGGGGGQQKKKSEIYNLGSIWEGQHGEYININDYYCEMAIKHKETGRWFKVKALRIGDPYNDQKGLLADLSINLENEKQAEFLGSDDE